MKIQLPDSPAIPLALVREALANIGLVLDAKRMPDGTHNAIWASDARALCAHYGCLKDPTVIIGHQYYCSPHARERKEELRQAIPDQSRARSPG